MRQKEKRGADCVVMVFFTPIWIMIINICEIMQLSDIFMTLFLLSYNFIHETLGLSFPNDVSTLVT